MSMTKHGEAINAERQMRGTLSHESSLHAHCFDYTPRSAFKKVLQLAEEGLAIRSVLSGLSDNCHPLAKVLQAMDPTAAVCYLVGLTLVTGDARSPKVGSDLDPRSTAISQGTDAIAGPIATNNGAKTNESRAPFLDDDDLDSFLPPSSVGS